MAIRTLTTRNSRVWLLMVTAVGVHVLDEALTGFLPFYNNLVLQLRDRWAWFPTFTFSAWIIGLSLAVAVGYALTPVVARGGTVIRTVCGFFSILMIANGLGHTMGSI